MEEWTNAVLSIQSVKSIKTGIGAHRACREIIYQSIFERVQRMEKVKRNGWKVVFLVVAALMCSHVLFGDAANWDPPGPPAPTMTSLDAIQSAVEGASCGVSEREGYFKKLNLVGPIVSEDLLTVPDGKRFVLLQLYYESGTGIGWSLLVNGSLLLDESILRSGADAAGGIHDFHLNFPDRCVVVEPSHTLAVSL
jgi:hypothetical protein